MSAGERMVAEQDTEKRVSMLGEIRHRDSVCVLFMDACVWTPSIHWLVMGDAVQSQGP